MPIRCILFDLDGTLVDSLDDISASLDAALARHGYGPVGRAAALTMVGYGARTLVERGLAAAGGTVDEADAVLATYLDEYGVRYLDRTRLYAGVDETLGVLHARGVRLGCVTNKPYDFSVRLLEHLGIARLFSAVLGGDSMAEKKPRPEPLLAAIEQCGSVAAETAMVGDGDTDMRAGRAAGVLTIGVTYGFRDRATLEQSGAMVLIDRFADLPGAIA